MDAAMQRAALPSTRAPTHARPTDPLSHRARSLPLDGLPLEGLPPNHKGHVFRTLDPNWQLASELGIGVLEM